MKLWTKYLIIKLKQSSEKFKLKQGSIIVSHHQMATVNLQGETWISSTSQMDQYNVVTQTNMAELIISQSITMKSNIRKEKSWIKNKEK